MEPVLPNGPTKGDSSNSAGQRSGSIVSMAELEEPRKTPGDIRRTQRIRSTAYVLISASVAILTTGGLAVGGYAVSNRWWGGRSGTVFGTVIGAAVAALIGWYFAQSGETDRKREVEAVRLHEAEFFKKVDSSIKARVTNTN